MLKGTFSKDGIIKDVWVNPAQIVTVEPSYKDEQTGQWYTTVTDVCGRDLTIEYSDSAIIASVDRTLHK
jgi:hypothetical protein